MTEAVWDHILTVLLVAALAVYGLWSATLGWTRVTRREALVRLLAAMGMAAWAALTLACAWTFYERYGRHWACLRGGGLCIGADGKPVEGTALAWAVLALILAAQTVRSIVKEHRP